MTRPVVVIGAGGHAKVVIDTLRAMEREIRACTDADPARHGTEVMGVRVVEDDDVLRDIDPSTVELVIGIGIPNNETARKRLALADNLMNQGYSFPPIVHPSAVIAGSVTLGAGAHVMAGTVVQPATRIGDFSIVNTGASVDHDCSIGRGVHIGPGAVVGGTVTVADSAMIGLGARILPGVTVGKNATVGAGAVVDRMVADDICVKGVPAR